MDERFEKPRKISTDTREKLVFNLLRDERWHTTGEINSPALGGSEGTRRLRELRKKGYPIEKRKDQNGDAYEYRMDWLF